MNAEKVCQIIPKAFYFYHNWNIFYSILLLFQELLGVPGEWEVPGPAAGLQAGPRQGAQREGAAQAWGQAEEERERGEEVRHGVLRRRHQVREVKVSMR